MSETILPVAHESQERRVILILGSTSAQPELDLAKVALVPWEAQLNNRLTANRLVGLTAIAPELTDSHYVDFRTQTPSTDESAVRLTLEVMDQTARILGINNVDIKAARLTTDPDLFDGEPAEVWRKMDNQAQIVKGYALEQAQHINAEATAEAFRHY